jgi:uncharacterized membrane protein
MQEKMRIYLLDILRGLSVLAMIFYHFFWDLGYFKFITLESMTRGLPLLFAQSVGASFIIISGISSRLLFLSDNFIAKFLKRLGILLFICILITSVTFFFDKNSYIFFGILHLLATCSILGLLLSFFRNNFILFLFFIFSLIVSLSDITFNLPNYLSWIGLNKSVPTTNDFYPLFPWVTFYLFGIWVFQPVGSYLEKYTKENNTNLFNDRPIFRFLEFLGRNSLTVYILHQPIFFSLFFIFIQLTS